MRALQSVCRRIVPSARTFAIARQGKRGPVDLDEYEPRIDEDDELMELSPEDRQRELERRRLRDPEEVLKSEIQETLSSIEEQSRERVRWIFDDRELNLQELQPDEYYDPEASMEYAKRTKEMRKLIWSHPKQRDYGRPDIRQQVIQFNHELKQKARIDHDEPYDATWDLKAGILVERPPQMNPPIEPWQREFFELKASITKRQQEARDWSHLVKKVADEKEEQRRKLREQRLKSGAAVSIEDDEITVKYVPPVHPPRLTKADLENDEKSYWRRLHEPLFLILRKAGREGQPGEWQLPQGHLAGEETVREVCHALHLIVLIQLCDSVPSENSSRSAAAECRFTSLAMPQLVISSIDIHRRRRTNKAPRCSSCTRYSTRVSRDSPSKPNRRASSITSGSHAPISAHISLLVCLTVHTRSVSHSLSLFLQRPATFWRRSPSQRLQASRFGENKP